MSYEQISRSSNNYFFAAGLLAFFGFGAVSNGGAHGALQLLLAIVMGGAGAYLRTGTVEARIAGITAASLTLLVGAGLFFTGNFYVPGTIMAAIGLFQLISAKPSVAQPMAYLPPQAAGPNGHQSPYAQPSPSAQPDSCTLPTQYAPPTRDAASPYAPPTQSAPPPAAPPLSAPGGGYFGNPDPRG